MSTQDQIVLTIDREDAKFAVLDTVRINYNEDNSSPQQFVVYGHNIKPQETKSFKIDKVIQFTEKVIENDQSVQYVNMPVEIETALRVQFGDHYNISFDIEIEKYSVREIMINMEYYESIEDDFVDKSIQYFAKLIRTSETEETALFKLLTLYSTYSDIVRAATVQLIAINQRLDKIQFVRASLHNTSNEEVVAVAIRALCILNDAESKGSIFRILTTTSSQHILDVGFQSYALMMDGNDVEQVINYYHQQSDNFMARKYAVYNLMLENSSKSYEFIYNEYKNSTDIENKKLLLRGLANFNKPEVLEVVLENLNKSDNDADIVLISATMLANLNISSHISETIKLIGHADSWVRYSLVKSLSKQADDAETMKKIFESYEDNEPFVKAEILQYLMKNQTTYRSFVIGQLQNENELIRKSVLIALSSSDASDSYIDTYIERAEKDENWLVRGVALDALTVIASPDNRVHSFFKSLLKKETNVILQQKINNWILSHGNSSKN